MESEAQPASLPFPLLVPAHTMPSIVHVCVHCLVRTSKWYPQPLQTAFLGLREVHSALGRMEMNLIVAVRVIV